MLFRMLRGMGGKKFRVLSPLLIGCMISGSLYGLGEKTLVLGAGFGWNSVEKRAGVIEIPLIRPNPVLALSSARSRSERSRDGTGVAAVPAADLAADLAGEFPPDMILSFDEGRPEWFTDRAGNYRVNAGASLLAASRQWAREGTGGARFSGDEESQLLIFPRTGGALFSPGEPVRDFSIEFWLYPFNVESGEQVLSWTSVRQTPPGTSLYQHIEAMFVRNRLRWTFTDFFSGPGDVRHPPLSLSSISSLVPQTWSHHLIRFDSDTGILEYVVNGKLEGAVYASSSGGEGGEVYCPVIGREGRLVLGGRYTGILDELRTYRGYIESPSLNRYPREGGRAETRPLDLGASNTSVLKIEALGGRFSGAGTAGSGGRVYHEYAGTENFRFSDNSALQFFIRAGNNPYGWTTDESEWLPIIPGKELPGSVRGRFVQLAAVFYPSGDGETTPYLDEIRITYKPYTPPNPPALVTATARDGAVELSWRANPEPEVGGYLVYYGGAAGEYFGGDAILGPSPIDVGKRTSIRIDGLRNGRVYYFSVAAYDRLHGDFPGPFSREVSARPLRMME